MALRTPLSVTPHLYMGDSTGRPLDMGTVYFGEQDKDPEFYPINLFSDDDLTKPLMQPVHTKGGYLYDKGDMVEPHAKEIIYSVKVLDSYGRKVFYKGAMMRNSWNDDVIAQINQAIIDSQQDVAAEAAKAVQEAIDNTAVEGGVLVDTFVTATAKAPTMVARTQRQVNAQTVTPYDFGVKGSFNVDTLADRFTTLPLAKAQYPNAIALTELADRVAFDAFLLYLIANQVVGANWSCQLLLDQPLVKYRAALTKLISGELHVKSYLTDLDYCLNIATPHTVINGSIVIQGTESNWQDLRTRKIIHGVVMGADGVLGTAGSADNCDIGFIKATNIIGLAYFIGLNAHFCKAGQVIGYNCGSGYADGGIESTTDGLTDNFTNPNPTVSRDFDQRSVLSVPNMRYTERLKKTLGSNVVIGGEPYEIISIDTVAKTVTIYPQLPSTLTSGRLLYIFGGAAGVTSNNSACTSIGTLQARVCGYALLSPALYGINIGTFICEYSGIAISVGGLLEAVLGNYIGLAYFEYNSVDVLYKWQMSDYSALTIASSIALNENKVWNLFGYRLPDNTRRSDTSKMGSGSIDFGGRIYRVDNSMYHLHDVSANTMTIVNQDKTVNLLYDPKLAQLSGRSDKTLQFVVTEVYAPRTLTINAPTGYTLNNATNLIIDMSKYNGIVSVTFLMRPADNVTNIIVVVSGELVSLKSGTTANRPVGMIVGYQYFDTTLGKPVYNNAPNSWVDAMGAIV